MIRRFEKFCDNNHYVYLEKTLGDSNGNMLITNGNLYELRLYAKLVHLKDLHGE